MRDETREAAEAAITALKDLHDALRADEATERLDPQRHVRSQVQGDSAGWLGGPWLVDPLRRWLEDDEEEEDGR